MGVDKPTIIVVYQGSEPTGTAARLADLSELDLDALLGAWHTSCTGREPATDIQQFTDDSFVARFDTDPPGPGKQIEVNHYPLCAYCNVHMTTYQDGYICSGCGHTDTRRDS